MHVLPSTSGITIPRLSAKHQDQTSPGSSEPISGWPLCSAWAVAWRFGESSQQPTLPH